MSRVGLTRANSYLQAATWGGFTAGPLLAGVLTAAGGTGLALAGVAVIYALGAAGLWVLPLAPRPPDGTAGAGRDGFAAQLSAGLRFLRADADAGLLVLVVGVMVVFANMAVVAEVAFAESVLRAGPTGYSVLVAAWTAGMLAGTLAGGRLPGHRLAVTTLAGTIAMGAGIALAGTAAHLWQAAAAYAFGGLANGMEVVATRSFLNHRAPEQVAGRVFAVYSGVLFGGASAGMAVAGGLLGSLSPRVVLFLAAGAGWPPGPRAGSSTRAVTAPAGPPEPGQPARCRRRRGDGHPFRLRRWPAATPHGPGRTLEPWYSHLRAAGCSAWRPATARRPSSASRRGSRPGCGPARNTPS